MTEHFIRQDRHRLNKTQKWICDVQTVNRTISAHGRTLHEHITKTTTNQTKTTDDYLGCRMIKKSTKWIKGSIAYFCMFI